MADRYIDSDLFIYIHIYIHIYACVCARSGIFRG